MLGTSGAGRGGERLATTLGEGEQRTDAPAGPLAGPTGGRGAAWLRRLPVAVPAVVLAVVGYTHRNVVDDGFIYLRIVRQLVEGNGPVFNVGERVEAYTSPAWVGVLAVADLLLPVTLEWLAVLVGLALAVAGVAAACAGALRLTRRPGDEHRWAVPLGAVVMVAPFATWVWATSGLETGLTWGWLGACLLLLARWATAPEAPIGRVAAVVLGLGWLVRPELVLLSALFLLAVLAGEWRTTSWRGRARTVAWFVAVPAAYQVFRMGYFGLLVANTAVAKEGTSTNWDRGASYLRDFADPYWLWVPLLAVAAAYLPLLAGGDLRRRLVAGSFLASGLVLGLYVVAIGGDYLHGRFYFPVLFAVCAPVAAVPATRRHAAAAVAAVWGVVAVAGLRPPQLDGPPLAYLTHVPNRFGDVTIADIGWGPDDRRLRAVDAPLAVETAGFGLGFAPASFEPAAHLDTPAVLVGAIGAVSYAAGPDVYVVDPLGLANAVGSHFEPAPGRRPGHEKPAPAPWLAAWVAAPAQRITPDDLGIPGRSEALGGGEFREQWAAAREAMQCEPIRRLQDAAAGHLGPRRFLRNLAQSFSNTLLRIPRDPHEAVEELC